MKGFAVLLFFCILALSGCGMGVVGGSSGPVGAITVQGVVHGGQQPVSQSTLQLWTVGTTGYGSNPTQVATTTSSSSGGFTLPGYTCASSNELLYLTATGGSPGASNPVNNQILLMAALGPCSQVNPALLGSTINVNLNEVTTVGSVYALAQFMSSTGGVGYPSASSVGVSNAFATVNNLVSIRNGAAYQYTPAGNGWVPQAEINTLANLLALCVNSSGSTASGQSCGNLFTATTHGSNVPTNTLLAVLNIALHPGDNPSGQWGLVTTGGPFQPTLTAQPSDWTMPVLFAGVGITTSDLAIDASGNIWTANAGGNSNGSISEISNLGQVAGTYEQNMDGLDAIAIDLGGNAWAANYSTGQIFELVPGSTPIGPISFQETANPQAVAVDGSNNVWITNTGSDSVTEICNLGAGSTAISPTGGFMGGNIGAPVDVGIDAAGDAWVTDSGSSSLTKIAPDGTVTAQPGSNLFSPSGIAVDASGDLWVTNGAVNLSNVSLLVEFNNVGTQMAAYSPGTSLYLQGTFDAVDGGNNVWVANELNGSISELSASGTVLSPAAGYLGPNVKVSATSYSGAAMPAPFEVRIDPSGNVWVPNLNGVPIGVGGSNAALTELVGLATPTIEPLALQVQQGLIGQLPGTSPGTTLVVTTSSLPSSVQMAKYSVQLLAKGGTGNGYTWQVTSGASTLSSVGLSLSSGGLLSGTLSGTVSGASIGVKVTDSAGDAAVKTLSLTVSALTMLSTPTNGTVGGRAERSVSC